MCTRFSLQCAIYAQDCTSFPNAQYMHKIVLLSQCTIYAQDLCKIVLLSPMCIICARLYFFPQCTIYAQDLHKIVLLSPVHNICTRFAQGCTSFPNAYMRKIVLLSPMHNICTRFAQDCTSFSNVQYMCKIVLLSLMRNIYMQDLRKIVLLYPMGNICAGLYFSPQCTRLSHHLCTKHHHSAGHKIFYFLIQIHRSNYIQLGEKKQIRCDLF